MSRTGPWPITIDEVAHFEGGDSQTLSFLHAKHGSAFAHLARSRHWFEWNYLKKPRLVECRGGRGTDGIWHSCPMCEITMERMFRDLRRSLVLPLRLYLATLR